LRFPTRSEDVALEHRSGFPLAGQFPARFGALREEQDTGSVAVKPVQKLQFFHTWIKPMKVFIPSPAKILIGRVSGDPRWLVYGKEMVIFKNDAGWECMFHFGIAKGVRSYWAGGGSGAGMATGGSEGGVTLVGTGVFDGGGAAGGAGGVLGTLFTTGATSSTGF